jgi:hypothetical protein
MSLSKSSVRPSINKNALHLFDGYPYLVTRIVPPLYHIILLPTDFGLEKLMAVARLQVHFNRLETCLVVKEDRCYFFKIDGAVDVTNMPPLGNTFAYDRLQPCIEIPETEELLQRKERLQAFRDSLKRPGFLHGDHSKGGRPASEEEVSRLSGKQANGVPTGLAQCPFCGCWAGECLHPLPEFPGIVIRVHCRCENDNLCARCGEPLDEYKLNSNYCKEDGQIWHVPGFCGFGHRCG